ncbi:MAG: serine hydrolase [Clostridia bacterium]|nr:serine hydrolase [Clostridia bacterium]
MRYPNPTFLNKASDIRYKRGRLLFIAITCLVVLFTLGLFVYKIASMQEVYKREYPELVGAATSESKSYDFEVPDYSSIAASIAADATTTTEMTTTETTPLAPVIIEVTPTPVPESTTEMTQNNAPDGFKTEDNSYFNTSYPLQTVSHEDRDMALDVLKQEISDYIKDNPNERICFEYINLASNEALGINELEVILPSFAYALPIEMLYYRGIANGLYSTIEVRTYQGEAATGNSSYIADNYEAGKQFYMLNLARYAIRYNDNLALSYLLEYMGGIDTLAPSLNQFSGYIDYASTQVYTDYTGATISSSHTSSCYDMAKIMEAFYYNYLREPETYQHLLNSLDTSNVNSGITNIFSNGASCPPANMVLNVSGTNDTRHAYFAMALVDGEEPFIVAIYSECVNKDRASTIQSDLSTYLARFISNCH